MITTDGWLPMHEAPKDVPVLLLVPTRWAKWSTYIQVQGEWLRGGYWVIFNGDEVVQRVKPAGWRTLHGTNLLDETK